MLKNVPLVCGIGWIRVTYRHDAQQNTDAVIDIDRVEDPLSIMIDPNSNTFDGSDANYMVEIHGKSDTGDEKYTYWWRDEQDNVKWAIIDGNKVEDKGVFPSTSFGLIPVYGEVYNIRNKTKIFGLIRQLRDMQKSYNYISSEGIERIAIAPKGTWISQRGSIAPEQRKDYLNASNGASKILEFDGIDENGDPVSAPVQLNTMPDTSWVYPMLSQLERSANEITGIYPDSYGDRSTAESGIAIKTRSDQSDRGQLVYDSHLQASIKQGGRVVLDLLDPVIGVTGFLPIMNEAGDKSVVTIGQYTPMMDEFGQPMYDQFGQPMMNEPMLPDLKVTDLEISISSAPAYAVRKQEGLDAIGAMLPSLPPEQQAQLIPKIIGDMDFPGADEYASIIGGGSGEGNSNPMDLQTIQELQAQLDQANQIQEQMQNEYNQMATQVQSNINAVKIKSDMDYRAKVAIEQMRIDAAREEKQKDREAEYRLAVLRYQNDQMKTEAQLSVDVEKITVDAEKANADIALKARDQLTKTVQNSQLMI